MILKQKVELETEITLEKFEIDGLDSEILFMAHNNGIYLHGDLYDCIGLDYDGAYTFVHSGEFETVQELFDKINSDFTKSLKYLRLGDLQDYRVDWGYSIDVLKDKDKKFYDDLCKELVKQYLKYHI